MFTFTYVHTFTFLFMFKTLKTFAQLKSNYMIKEFSLLFLNSLNVKTELGSSKILFQSNFLLKEFSLLFFNFLNLKTDLLVLCSSSLFKFFVQVFCSSFLFKYCVLNLENLCSCKIKLCIWKNNYLSCFWTLWTWKLSLAHVKFYSNQMICYKNSLSGFLTLWTWKLIFFVLCSSSLFKFFV